jgi:prepilin-type N-terminal cleavage/methylation domain-containing protein/prepilin-type processing-associated H-X9-DG protein
MIVKKGKKVGFTLVELLVVISIIALLLSILMPALNKVRESGRRVVCASNIKQIGFGLMLYAQDNKGYGVNWAAGDRHWLYRLSGYLGSNASYSYSKTDKEWNNSQSRKYPKIRVCPSNNLQKPPYYESVKGYKWIISYSDYVRQDYAGGDGKSASTAYSMGFNETNRLIQIKRPVDMVTFREGYEGGVQYSGWYVQQYIIKARHSGGENFTFADGHSQWYGNTSYDARTPNTEIFRSVTNGSEWWSAHFHISPLNKP